ncbi:MAG: Holliday junction resolvase RuvX [Gammaproteobacteria bacterium]|jgi:putative Holliday junction resolvase
MRAKAHARSVMGFDFGLQRIGLATGQTLTGTATPLTTLHAVNHKPDWDSISSQIEQWQPDVLIVGIPYQLDGGESDITRAARNFSRQLEQRFSLPVYTIDESLSSYAAEQALKTEKKIAKHNKHEVDKIAAAMIVQSWLNSQQ